MSKELSSELLLIQFLEKCLGSIDIDTGTIFEPFIKKIQELGIDKIQLKKLLAHPESISLAQFKSILTDLLQQCAPAEARRIGHYELLSKLGEGGMGEVFRAVRLEPFFQPVALKIQKEVLKGNQAARSRFQWECQALAQLNHPNIATIYDAGEIENRPFIAMELITGQSIIRFCNEKKLPIRERLELVIQICHGLSHAHTRGIVHQDLKPSNILVSTSQGKPIVKILDFGLATTVSSFSKETLALRARLGPAGTLGYMSPQQESNEIDIRNDIFSLGMILLELVGGIRPTFLSNDDGLATRESREVWWKEEWHKLRLDQKREIADQRSCYLRDINQLINADFSYVIGKTIATNSKNRYQNLDSLKDDLNRHLQNKLPSAAPRYLPYLISKWFLRNRLIIVLLFIFGSAIMAIWISKTLAGKKTDVLEMEKTVALEEALSLKKKLEHARFFMKDFLINQRPSRSKDEDGVFFALEKVEKELGELPNDQWSFAADLGMTLGQTWYGLGYFEKSEKLFQSISEKLGQRLGPSSQQVLEARNLRAKALIALGDYGIAADIFREILDQTDLTDQASEYLYINTMLGLSDAVLAQGNYTEAESLSRNVVEKLSRSEEVQVEDRERLFKTAQFHLARALLALGNPGQALRLCREVIAWRYEKLGENHPATLQVMYYLGFAHLELNQPSLAYPVLVKTCKLRGEVLGEDHQATLAARDLYARCLKNLGRLPEAEKVLRQVLKKRMAGPAPHQLNTLLTMNNLANVLALREEMDEAEEWLERALTTFETSGSMTHPDALKVLNNAADLLIRRKRFRSAHQIAVSVLACKREILGEDHPSTLASLCTLGEALQGLGDLKAAEQAFRKAYELAESTGRPIFITALYRGFLANCLTDLERWDEAEKLLNKSLKELEGHGYLVYIEAFLLKLREKSTSRKASKNN